jgi:ABC-2 type transport system ATP-binding protein
MENESLTPRDYTAGMIEVRHLRMEYDTTVALEDLNLTIPQGEVYGLIGPNGAGKTTLLRILATLMEPTYGEVTIAGIDVLREPLRVRPLIGYMSDVYSLYDNMQVDEYLDHFARCYGILERQPPGYIDDLLRLVSLEVRRDSEIRTLSRGMRQRLCFAKTLLHEPKVLLLDEPASGMDPMARLEFRELLKQLHAMGRTILISSHILTEMAEFCTSVGILEQGKLLASGRVEDILRQLAPALELEIEFLGDPEKLLKLLGAHAEVEGIERNNGRVRCRWRAGKETLPQLHRRIVEEGVQLVALGVRTDNLEDIYMKISKHQTA